MPMPKLTCTTPHGTFRRWTARDYTHVVVRAVDGHHTHSWHLSEQAAQQAAQSHIEGTTVAGIYPVDTKGGRS